MSRDKTKSFSRAKAIFHSLQHQILSESTPLTALPVDRSPSKLISRDSCLTPDSCFSAPIPPFFSSQLPEHRNCSSALTQQPSLPSRPHRRELDLVSTQCLLHVRSGFELARSRIDNCPNIKTQPWPWLSKLSMRGFAATQSQTISAQRVRLPSPSRPWSVHGSFKKDTAGCARPSERGLDVLSRHTRGKEKGKKIEPRALKAVRFVCELELTQDAYIQISGVQLRTLASP